MPAHSKKARLNEQFAVSRVQKGAVGREHLSHFSQAAKITSDAVPLRPALRLERKDDDIFK